MSFTRVSGRGAIAALALAAIAASFTAAAADFSVSPIRADLRPGAMNETITVTNDASKRLRVTMKVMLWTQDDTGKDVYTDTGDLVYFPRQMDVEPGARRLVRVGAKNPAAGNEQAYRLFIEEVPEAPPPGSPAAVNFFFRFGVPVFVPPAGGKPQPEIGEPTLQKGVLALAVRNPGNQHFRLTRLTVKDGAGYSQDVPGWYSLAGTARTYQASIPRDVCRKARTLSVTIEAEFGSFDRNVHVDPASCS